MALDAMAVNLWGFVALGAVALAVFAAAPRRRANGLLAAYIGGYAAWSVIFFLPAASRQALAIVGALSATAGGLAIVAYARSDALGAPAPTRMADRTALALAAAATLFGEAMVYTTYDGLALTAASRATAILFAGIMPFVASVGAALVLLAFRTRASPVALTTPAGWTILGLAALAGLVGARYWMAGPPTVPYYYGLAAGYTAGIVVAAALWLTGRAEPSRGRTLSWTALALLLFGMLAYLAWGSVATPGGAIANHVGRFLAFGATIRGAFVGVRS